MRSLVLLALCLSVALVSASPIATPWTFSQDPDFFRNVTQIITSKGYPVEEHEVVTADGFILGLQRITAGKNGNNPPVGFTQRPPVLVMHGLLDSSAAWVMNTEEESLGYILANAGFDVWLGNSRGNFYSRRHSTLTPADKQFWAFSFDDMAKYDLPAMIQHIIDTTGAPKVGYIGHSQGTIQMFAGLSASPDDLGSKLYGFAALAPVTHVGNSTSILIKALAAIHIDGLFQLFGAKEFLPSSIFLHTIGALFCPILPWACEDFIFLLCGPDNEPMHNLNATRFPVYVAHTPAGTSVQNMAHWAQSMRSGDFGMYDFGSASANYAKYGQSNPPAYDLSKIKQPPIQLYTGSQDSLADPADVMWLLESMSPGVIVGVNNQPDYEHLDFTWGVDCHERIYPGVVSFLLDQARSALQA